ncbi:MAG TPA: hydrogenase maturation nickel metallochaperone HypA [bacterium]|nr:hydrogenase maturation nickel metallochaperone HypA [bacterium]HOL47036.1 hydrogenase maturation nickel metallochaperone HypA [bacterium]HPQ18462.1 hydrogenase maturation nickel metallochaperone HypA [bacterium]
MHEFSICSNLFNILNNEIKEKYNLENKKINSINIVIGKLNWIFPDIFEDCFKIIAKDTIFQNTKLNIISQPAIIKCIECSNEFEITEPIFICNKCYSNNIEIITGNQLYIESIDIEENK